MARSMSRTIGRRGEDRDVPLGVLFYLLRGKNFVGKTLEKMLYERSGLLGLSGISGDMRELEKSQDSRAAVAIDFFVYAMTKFTGAYGAGAGWPRCIRVYRRHW